MEACYGLNANFFVGSYNESASSSATYLYKKNTLGTVSGMQLNFALNARSGLFAGYSRSVNKGTKNFQGTVNGVQVFINDFNLRHFNHFLQIGYERSFHQSHLEFRFHAGLVWVGMQQQEISIENFNNQIVVEERNIRNSRLQEAGVFAGLSYVKNLDKHFELGVRMRAYYLVSSNNFEAITFTPILVYKFK